MQVTETIKLTPSEYHALLVSLPRDAIITSDILASRGVTGLVVDGITYELGK